MPKQKDMNHSKALVKQCEASIKDLQKIQARLRKWRSKLELIQTQESLKINKQLITIQEAKNEQRTEK